MATRTALVTGANGELGRAISEQLAAAGLQVVVAAREREVADQVAAGIGAGARAVAMDVTDPDSVRRAVDAAGPVDVLVNNAGVLLDAGSRPVTADLGAVAQEFAVNALGAWRVAQAVLPGMLSRRWGRVVNISSGTGSFAFGLFPSAPGYSASKTALNAVTVLLAKDTEGTGVLVNAINPGQLRSRMRPQGKRLPEEAAVDVANLVALPDDGPTGTFFRAGGQVMAW
ncbi:SDR family NAD(P)-dependent oxidoreductase [Saccharopolyspora indica]|uniref:SDR family NAD(P)-dependent oxidoreductase n=1 Tax=Saccharopolyspora indica TaxID=1229659 RepID=UPI0022EA4C18|nr:SDR family NAD(P)-dependent oxidoreductase [Saccharopolyspora indica]MDA3647656.1 SDR family NAD(P)-dependent oxidoreductase [Saccharopolyspora indica]